MGWLQGGYGGEMPSSFSKIQHQQYWMGGVCVWIPKKEQ